MTFFRSDKADAEVVGHMLILSLTIIGISLIAVVGLPNIIKLQEMATVKNIEQTYTLLDSRASSAIIGSSPMQKIDLNLGGGILAVEPNGTAQDKKSYIVINSSNFSFTVPMGKIKYRLGDRVVAYEGGGVWSKYPSGGSVMLSPPEFHYNGWTLTLPVVNIKGNASVGGKGTASLIFINNGSVVLYPNSSDKKMANPVKDSITGKVYVNITSEFYDAWADFAKSLSYAKVSTNSTTGTAHIELTVVPGNLGKNTSITNPLTFRGLESSDPEPLENFSFRVYGSPPSGNLNSLDWQIEAKSGTKRVVWQIKKGSSNKIDIKVGFIDTGFAGSYKAEAWEKDGAFNIVSGSPDYADINLLDKSITLTYEKETVPDGATCWSKIDKNNVNTSSAFTWLPDKIISTTENNSQSLYNITQHYFQLMSPDVSLDRCSPGGSDPISYGSSNMLINYSSIGTLTYMDITRNDADIILS